MTDEERRQKIEEMRERLKSVPASVQLARLLWWQTHCFKCEAEVAFSAEVCESCGEELMEYGKH
jgi:rRNA maturation endonuclease Nob1